MKPYLKCVFAASCCGLFAGCAQNTSENGGRVFYYQGAVLLLLLTFAGLPAVVFLIRRKESFRALLGLAFIGTILAVGLTLGLVPDMLVERVVVNDQGFSRRHGPWWNPTTQQIRFDELNEVRLVTYQYRGSRTGKTYTSSYFDCTLKPGDHERVRLKGLMQDAWPEITEQLRKHGVPLKVSSELMEKATPSR